MRYQAPRGTNDILPEQTPRWRYLEATFRRVCDLYGYQEIRTPIFEATDLFARTAGEHSDIVTKQMYTFSMGQTEESESLTLRPEGTAPAVRAYLENSLVQKSPLTKLSYIAPIFRYERPQAGRYRQHHQTGIEALGATDPALDAEVIALGVAYLDALGITGYTLHLNSVGCPICRPAYRDAIRAAVGPKLAVMCDDCKRRYDGNPLRILDCKNEDWDKLGIVVPEALQFLCTECAEHFRGVQGVLTQLGIAFEVDPRLVRGLDYYTKTAFEITHPGLGAQSTLIGGGRYDGLVEEIGGPATPGIGFGSGIERVLLTAEALGLQWPVAAVRPVFVATLGESARLPGITLLAALRATGIPAEIDYLGRSLKAQLRHANRLEASFAVILGEDEVARGEVTLRDLGAGTQESVPRTELAERLKQAFETADERR
jgi:histidyl-tRNA synthetase